MSYGCDVVVKSRSSMHVLHRHMGRTEMEKLLNNELEMMKSWFRRRTRLVISWMKPSLTGSGSGTRLRCAACTRRGNAASFSARRGLRAAVQPQVGVRTQGAGHLAVSDADPVGSATELRGREERAWGRDRKSV